MSDPRRIHQEMESLSAENEVIKMFPSSCADSLRRGCGVGEGCGNPVRMDDVLLGIVLERLDRYQLSDQAADLLLAALEGDEALAVQLREPTAERYVPA